MVRGGGRLHHVDVSRCMYIYRGGLVTPGAAVHRHTLDRVNVINNSLKIKIKNLD